MKQKINFFLLFLIIALPILTGCKEGWDLLSIPEQATLSRILAKWETWVPKMKDEGTAPMITFEELYAGLSNEETELLERVRKINPKKDFGFQGKYLGTSTEGAKFKKLDDQWIERNSQRVRLAPQYVPEKVYSSYELMMTQMLKDTGKRLWIESAYRSPAYQLYTFLYYLPSHGYSLAETGKWVAIPGYSEHGYPPLQALDLISSEGINGDDDGQTVEDFENLEEYKWLMARAHEFDFYLSYPRANKGITFEPWHWHHEPGKHRNS